MTVKKRRMPQQNRPEIETSASSLPYRKPHAPVKLNPVALSKYEKLQQDSEEKRGKRKKHAYGSLDFSPYSHALISYKGLKLYKDNKNKQSLSQLKPKQLVGNGAMNFQPVSDTAPASTVASKAKLELMADL